MMEPYRNSNLKDHSVRVILRCQGNKFFPFPLLASTLEDISECHANHPYSLQDLGKEKVGNNGDYKPLNIDFFSVLLSLLSSAIIGRGRTSDLKRITWIHSGRNPRID